MGTPDDDGRLLKAVQAVAISPSDAKAMVAKYYQQARNSSGEQGEEAVRDAVVEKIIQRYARLAAGVGGTTALTGIIPGIGTAVAMLGGAATDAAACMKLQVDMCMCLAEAYGWDLDSEDAQHLAFLIAAGGTLEKAGAGAAVNVASKAGVKMLRQYLRGAVLVTIKELFKKVGVTFTRKALEKALPFGIGVAVGSSANYALTLYVGRTASTWFKLDLEERASG